jgi:hypothetical protein
MFAYIDPGSGALILQLIVAAAVGTIAFFRQSVFRVFGWFKPKKTETPKADPKVLD